MALRVSICFIALSALVACSPNLPQAIVPDSADAATRIEADVRYLADDLLEGRETGTRGYDLAAHYVASEFRKLGLKPVASASYLQPVPLLRGQTLRDGARFAIERDGNSTDFIFEDDYVPQANFSEASSTITAPLVFVGQAVHAPELGHDDFEGVDVRDKIAVMFANAPSNFPIDERAFHASRVEKARLLEARGAIGVISLRDPKDEEKRPWALGAKNWASAGMRLRDAAGKPIEDFPGLRVRISMRASLAETLFVGAPHSAAEILTMLRENRLKSFDLPGTATLSQATETHPVESFNVVGRLAGSDAALAGEHVVLTAHLDHLGIGAPINGDSIYNGALDNALGVSVMLEAARAMVAAHAPPKRSVLFVAFTGEEKGLLGAFHFVAAPPVDKSSIVANVNMDMPVLLGALSDVVPIGMEHLQGEVSCGLVDAVRERTGMK